MASRSSGEHGSDDSKSRESSRESSRDPSDDASSDDEHSSPEDDAAPTSDRFGHRFVHRVCSGGVETYSLGTTIDWSVPFPSVKRVQNAYDAEGKIVSDVYTLQNGTRVRIVVMPRSGPKNEHLGVFVVREEIPVEVIHSARILRSCKKNIKPLVMCALHIHIMSSTFRGRARFQAAGRIWQNIPGKYGFHGSKMLCTHRSIENDPERFIDKEFMKLRIFILTPRGGGMGGAGASNGALDNQNGERLDPHSHLSNLLGERMYIALASDARQGDMEFSAASTTRRSDTPLEPKLVLRAHSSVMTTLSPVISGVVERMIAQGQHEPGERICITCPEGISEQVIHNFIKYLYIGKSGDILSDDSDRSSMLATQFFILGDVFEISHLTKLCESAIKTTLDVSNCCSMAARAHKNGCKRLQEIVMQFMCANEDKIMSIPENMDIMRECPQLAMMMMDFKYQNKRKRDAAGNADGDSDADADEEDEDDEVDDVSGDEGGEHDELGGFLFA